MSKGNMLLGHARGKVGDLVFSRSNGQQVTRARAAQVKNPQTEAQVIQRLILNTVSQAYSRMASIADHSFEGVAVGQDSMSAFMKKNMANTRARVAQGINEGHQMDDIMAFTCLGDNHLMINPYVIASGSLPTVAVKEVVYGTGAKLDAIAANTYQAVIDKYGLKRGDQLTFCVIYMGDNGDNYFGYNRVILDPRDANGEALPLSTAFIDSNAIASPSPRNEGNFEALSYAAEGITFAIGTLDVCAAAIIVSRQKTDGSWSRSNATMVFDQTAIDNDGWASSLQQAIDLFYASGIDLESNRFLNNATRGTSATSGSINP